MYRERYIQMRNTGQLEVSTLHEISKELGMKLSIDEFATGLSYGFINSVTDTLDKHFGLTVMTDKNNRFIKAW